MMENIDISRYLIKKYGKVCTSAEIQAIFGKNYLKHIVSLTNTWWIRPLPVFKGVYYVLDAEEKQMHLYRQGKFQILIRALDKVLGTNWYFARSTALHLLGAINQPVSRYYIANPKVSKRVVSKFFGELIFIRTNGRMGSRYGIRQKKYKDSAYRLSSIERIIGDYLYLYVHGHVTKKALLDLRGKVHYNASELKRIVDGAYPRLSTKKMRNLIR